MAGTWPHQLHRAVFSSRGTFIPVRLSVQESEQCRWQVAFSFGDKQWFSLRTFCEDKICKEKPATSPSPCT